MHRLMPHTLQSKFLSGMILLMFGLVAFFGVALNRHLGQLMEGESRDKAALILAQVEAMQHYVRSTLRPTMYETLPNDQFVLEAMSTSFITRAVMSDPNLAREGFLYRRVTRNARNPDYEADGMEREFLRQFEADPALTHVEQVAVVDGEPNFITVYVQRFDETCMHCHGDPAEAPRELIARYGAERGFGRQVGQIAGIDMIRLKIQRNVGSIREATFSFALFFASGFLLLFLFIQGFFHRLVVQSLRRATGVMQRLFPEEAQGQAQELALQPAGRDDEIEGILHGFELFAEHLRQARQDLRDYAATLEEKVAGRTVELTRLADERRADVALFVSLLNSLNDSQSKQELLLSALQLIAERFGAARAAYVCLLASWDFAAWPDPRIRPALPRDWHDLVTNSETRLDPQAWYIPVQTSGTSRGLLCLYWDDAPRSHSRMADLARAVGQQLGIAMENLEALDGLLRQNAMLSSIFEGVADPLLLLDAGGAVLLANTPARELARSLTSSPGDPPGDSSGESSGESGKDLLLDRLFAATASTDSGEFELEDGRVFTVNLYALKESGGRRVASLRDITLERRMEGQMLRNERLVAVGQLAAGLAHEINNPLGVISCYTELLMTSQKEEQAQADLAVIMRHIVQARRVVRDLLDFARPRPVTSGPSDLAAVAAATVEVLQPRAKTSKATLVFAAHGALPPVEAGVDMLEHILTNLMMNALDAVDNLEARCGRHGAVQVSVCREDGLALLTVADNGPGILPEHLNRVFDPFFTTKEAGKGTGLGLSVIYGLTRELGGSIEVESTPNHGAAFKVRLPLAAEA
ncbi:c-type heme family protein [Megalodesulfovibrio paquesii]